MFGLGLLFTLAIAPYAFLYLSGQQYGSSKNYEFVIYILKNFFPPNISDAPAVLISFIKITMMNGVLPIAIVSIIILSFIKNKERRDLNLTLIWMIGILMISIVIPFFIGLIEKIFRLIPIESVLTRGLRYAYPLLLLLFVWALAEISKNTKKKAISFIVIMIGILFLLFYGISQKEYFLYPWQKIEYLFLQGKPVCITDEIKGQAIESIKNLTPPGSKIFAYSWKGIETTEFYEIRYAALRPLVFHIRDGGSYLYMNYDKLKNVV